MRRSKLDANFALFKSESLKWPGFVEFDDANEMCNLGNGGNEQANGSCKASSTIATGCCMEHAEVVTPSCCYKFRNGNFIFEFRDP